MQVRCGSCGTRLRQKHSAAQLGLSVGWIMIAVALINGLSGQVNGLLTALIIGAWVVLYLVASRQFMAWEDADAR